MPGTLPNGVVCDWIAIADAGTDDLFSEEVVPKPSSDDWLEGKKYEKQRIAIRCFEFLDNALNGTSSARVLVHCALGVNRSATITVAYLMRTQQWTKDYAFGLVEKKRPLVNPVDSYRWQLGEYEKKLLAQGIQLNNSGGGGSSETKKSCCCIS
eukprot:gnl/MRDRNA2_/MRDRNA2_469146_c0_seq1.p1 gnl/MRDRNA2_/MRDRNA2_469146_c0~~gnl/MRDRNA2_/MRDRNA2_469146_c0_seq1.p1  ORF type:complete len:176 (+),score=25.62 gnl/MRDRNA2_/MRDRNA2_469146_c0_seq1:68-529(+)